jgi:hypothetical protein
MDTIPAAMENPNNRIAYRVQFNAGVAAPLETTLKNRNTSGMIAPATPHQNAEFLVIATATM